MPKTCFISILATVFFLSSLSPVQASETCEEQADLLGLKSGCYLSGYSQSCEMLSLLSVGSTAFGAGAAGRYASEFLLLKTSSDVRALENLKKRIPELKKIMRLQQDLAQIEGQLAQKTSSIGQNQDGDQADKYELFKKEIAKNEGLKKFFDDKGSFDATASRMAEKLIQEMRNEASKIFPQEKSILAEIERIQNKNEPFWKKQKAELNELRKRNLPEDDYLKHQDEIVEKYNIVEKTETAIQKLKMQNPAKAMYINLFSHYGLSGDLVFGYNFKKDTLALERGQQSALARNAKVSVVGGTAIGTAAGLGVGSRGQLDLRLCQSKLGLTDAELDFLTNNRFLGLGSAKAYSDGGCDNFRIPEPEDFVKQARSLFRGQIPKGICKIIDDQSRKYDQMIGDSAVNPKLSCEGSSDSNYTLKDGIFEFRDGMKTYKSSYNSRNQFPDFRSLKVYSSDGKTEDKIGTLEFHRKYNVLRSMDQANPRIDLTEIDFATQKDQSVFPKGMVQSAVRARIAAAYSKVSCDANNAASGSSTTGHDSKSAK